MYSALSSNSETVNSLSENAVLLSIANTMLSLSTYGYERRQE